MGDPPEWFPRGVLMAWVNCSSKISWGRSYIWIRSDHSKWVRLGFIILGSKSKNPILTHFEWSDHFQMYNQPPLILEGRSAHGLGIPPGSLPGGSPYKNCEKWRFLAFRPGYLQKHIQVTGLIDGVWGGNSEVGIFLNIGVLEICYQAQKPLFLAIFVWGPPLGGFLGVSQYHGRNGIFWF
jgi:hypothetical protein